MYEQNQKCMCSLHVFQYVKPNRRDMSYCMPLHCGTSCGLVTLFPLPLFLVRLALYVICIHLFFSWAPMVMPSWSQITATSWHTLTYDPWWVLPRALNSKCYPIISSLTIQHWILFLPIPIHWVSYSLHSYLLYSMPLYFSPHLPCPLSCPTVQRR